MCKWKKKAARILHRKVNRIDARPRCISFDSPGGQVSGLQEIADELHVHAAFASASTAFRKVWPQGVAMIETIQACPLCGGSGTCAPQLIKPARDYKVLCGKYKGNTVGAILNHDPDYAEWMAHASEALKHPTLTAFRVAVAELILEKAKKPHAQDDQPAEPAKAITPLGPRPDHRRRRRIDKKRGKGPQACGGEVTA